MKLCIDCAKEHKFIEVKGYVYIDGKKWVSKRRNPAREVKCSECGIKTSITYEPYRSFLGGK